MKIQIMNLGLVINKYIIFISSKIKILLTNVNNINKIYINHNK